VRRGAARRASRRRTTPSSRSIFCCTCSAGAIAAQVELDLLLHRLLPLPPTLARLLLLL
jgi:hypothetical protein